MPKTKLYNVSSVVTISVFTVVKADSEEKAKQIALVRGMMGLCHQCARGNKTEEWVTSGELDGELEQDSIVVEEY